MFRKELLQKYSGDYVDDYTSSKLKRYGTMEELERFLLHRRVIEWTEDYLKLDNGIVVTIEMSEYDCCAYAGGKFAEVELDALITDIDISEIKSDTHEWGEIDNSSTVTLYHNQNPIAQADITADAGNGGYYYSVGSLVIKDIHFPIVDS